MKIVFQDDGGKELGSVDIDQSVVDAIKASSGESVMGEDDGKMSDMFAMKKPPAKEAEGEEEVPEEDEGDEEAPKVKKPLKFKRPGLF
jgi:hypothetical protein